MENVKFTRFLVSRIAICCITFYIKHKNKNRKKEQRNGTDIRSPSSIVGAAPAPFETPGMHAGSFSFSGRRAVAAELITPLDHETGIPLPILPTGVLERDDPNTNWHHAWHANSAPQLQGVGGRALRHSRVQLVRDIDHNHGDKEKGKLTYHDYYVGPPLPETDDERFRLCVIAAAGHVPDKAIDLWSADEPQVVTMTPAQKQILREPERPRPMNAQDRAWVTRRAKEAYGLLESPDSSFETFLADRFADFNQRRRQQAALTFAHLVYQYDPLRTFLRETVLEQDLSHVREARVDEFLYTKDEERRLRLGRWLLGEAVHKATDSVRLPYRRLHIAGSLHPGMPSEADGLVVWKLGARGKRNELVEMHKHRLRQQLGMAA